MKLDDESNVGELRQLDVHVGVEWSASPDSNFVATWKMKQGQGHLDNIATFNRGTTSRDSHYMLTVAHSFKYDVSLGSLRLHNRMHMTLPARGVDFEVMMNHLHSNFVMDNFLLARYAPSTSTRFIVSSTRIQSRDACPGPIEGHGLRITGLS